MLSKYIYFEPLGVPLHTRGRELALVLLKGSTRNTLCVLMATAEVTLEYVKGLALAVRPLMLEGFGCGAREACASKSKTSAADLVTEYDCRVEQALKNKIKIKFPNHVFLCEESASPHQRLTDEPTWIIDPIDGTTNFVHGFPFTCVSIAFSEKKQVRFGVVYSPVTNEMFAAEKGKGAYLNGNPLSASKCKDVGKALACISFGVSTLRQIEEVEDANSLAYLQHFRECVLSNVDFVTTHCRDIRHLGSTAMELCYLGAGRLDCVASFGPKEWDMAAGFLILEEAGAVCSDMEGNRPLDLSKHHVLAAATHELLAEMLKNLRGPKP